MYFISNSDIGEEIGERHHRNEFDELEKTLQHNKIVAMLALRYVILLTTDTAMMLYLLTGLSRNSS